MAASPILVAMASTDSVLDPDQLARAKALLGRPERPQRMWPVLAAAAFLAVSALAFATAMILAPPLTHEHVAHRRGAA
ncbi:MAG TPA: hypothetical protein VFE18_02350 [Phenylobacterium sp.]|uniref:hypothetical protein n=1 Tax=Phenylobacterium sp. TaxID=1871053 RepID=UPI002D605921|nr:hypothetical protein [Phenylobacterium sp.]HZZ66990.1 hypothetical protein [Phenylobacterium sp.]